MDSTYAVVDHVATEIAEAYSSFGNLSALLLGQRSTPLFLSLLPLLYEETLTYYLFLIGEEAEEYAASEDPAALFTERCQAIVQANSYWQTVQGKRKTTLPSSLSDPGYVVIQQAIARLQADASAHLHS
ncbi:MAG TPA: hypothetical protein VFC80_05135 [Sphaerochaeta sp.]|nr:hypothetical protein [Sphaerochaeta sp.]